MYRMADIYILPSYYEGFPRTLWEAMANSVPVICTSVGSIPLELDNYIDALIIEPRNINEIKISIENLLVDSVLRKTLIKNGIIKASQNTLEIQSKKLIKKIKIK
jgi:glycosyltransferase involved in cell wall biosynthesis